MGKEVGMNEDVAQTVIDSIDRDKNGQELIHSVIYIFIHALHLDLLSSQFFPDCMLQSLTTLYYS